MPNKPISNEQLAELDRLHEAAIKGMNWQEVAQFQAMIAEQYQPLRQRLLAAESRLADAGRERDQLRALVEDIRQQRDYWQEEAVEMRRYKEASESLVAGLRGALEEAGDAVHACVCETEEIRGKVCHSSCIAINTALALTPASAGDRTDEETEAANGR